MMTSKASWYIAGIPLYCIDSDPLRPDEWQDKAIAEVVHYKGSNQSAVHKNGFSAEAIGGLPVKVHEGDHLALKALRLTSVVFVRVSDGETRTAVLMEYDARKRRGECWYQGIVDLVDV